MEAIQEVTKLYCNYANWLIEFDDVAVIKCGETKAQYLVVILECIE